MGQDGAANEGGGTRGQQSHGDGGVSNSSHDSTGLPPKEPKEGDQSHSSQPAESSRVPDVVDTPAGDVPSGSGGHVAHAQCPTSKDGEEATRSDACGCGGDVEAFETARFEPTKLAAAGAVVRPALGGTQKSTNDTLSPTIPVKYAMEQLREGRDHAAIRRELAQISSERVCEDDEMGKVYRKRALQSITCCGSKRQCVPLEVSCLQEFQPDPCLNGILNPPILGQNAPSNSWLSRLFRK